MTEPTHSFDTPMKREVIINGKVIEGVQRIATEFVANDNAVTVMHLTLCIKKDSLIVDDTKIKFDLVEKTNA